MSLLLLQAVDAPYVARDAAGAALPFATLTVYLSGTTELALPVVTADAAGEFAALELDAGEYRIEMHTAAGVLVWSVDPYSCTCGDADPILFRSPINQALDDDDVPYPGAALTFTDSATGDPLDVYADAALTHPWPNPLTANAGGWFPPVYLDDAAEYDVVLEDADGNEILSESPYTCDCEVPIPAVLVMVASAGAGDRTAYSLDGGLTWTAVAAIIASRAWDSLAWAPEIETLVAGATDASTTNLMYSLDRGVTWIASNAKSNADSIVGVTWAPWLALFVAGTAINVTYTSPDGITWTRHTVTGSYAGRATRYMVAVPEEQRLHCTDNSSSGYSANGTAFTVSLTQGTRRLNQSLAYSPALDVAVASGTINGNYWTSADIQAWTNTGVTTGSGASNNPVAWSPTLALFASVYAGTGGVSPVFKTSANGTGWTTETVADHTAGVGLCWSTGYERFVSCGFSSSTGRVAYSTDGHTWTQVAAPNNSSWSCIIELP